MSSNPPARGYSPDTSYSSDMSGSISSRGFEFIDSVSDDRSVMEANMSEIVSIAAVTKQSLTYGTEDSIEDITKAVGPLLNLENEISKKIDWLKEIVSQLSQAGTVDDNIPKTTLEKLRQVNKIAKEGNASTFTAVSSLDTIMNAFKYGRDAANDTFTLTREAQRKLKDYDEAFLDMIKLQIKFEIELAESKCEQCFQILEEAKGSSKNDEARLTTRQRQEDQKSSLEELEAIHTAANQDLQEEETEFSAIEKNCQADLLKIDRQLNELSTLLSSVVRINGQRENDRRQKLAKNREKQEELKRKLRQLEAEEREYRRVDDEEGKMMEDTKRSHNRAETELVEWKDKISMIEQQASASLRILEVMKAGTDEVLRDAKARKKQWEQRLVELELESMIITRSVLVATYCLYKMEAEDCSRNVKDSEEEIERNKLEMQDAARRKYREKIQDLKEKSENLVIRKQTYSEKLAKHNAKVEETADEIASTSARIRDLDSRMSLEPVEEIYQRRVQMKETCFEKQSVEDAMSQLFSSL